MKQLDPRAVWLFFISSVVQRVFLVFVFSFGIIAALAKRGDISVFLWWLWIIVPAIIVLCFVWSKLTYRFYRYELTDIGFRKESGVIYKRYTTIPYSRIQNVDIYRGIVARLLGLSDLQIQTAGGGAAISRYGMMGVGAEGELPGLSREDAEELRDELIRRVHQSKSQGL